MYIVNDSALSDITGGLTLALSDGPTVHQPKWPPVSSSDTGYLHEKDRARETKVSLTSFHVNPVIV